MEGKKGNVAKLGLGPSFLTNFLPVIFFFFSFWGERQREREGDNLKQTAHSAQSPMLGLIS